NYAKQYHYETVIMGASFRNAEQITALSGCDFLTISPALMQELQNDPTKLNKCLSIENAKKHPQQKITFNESTFRWQLNEDAMATEKLAEGIRIFAKDGNQLKAILAKKIL